MSTNGESLLLEDMAEESAAPPPPTAVAMESVKEDEEEPPPPPQEEEEVAHEQQAASAVLHTLSDSAMRSVTQDQQPAPAMAPLAARVRKLDAQAPSPCDGDDTTAADAVQRQTVPASIAAQVAAAGLSTPRPADAALRGTNGTTGQRRSRGASGRPMAWWLINPLLVLLWPSCACAWRLVVDIASAPVSRGVDHLPQHSSVSIKCVVLRST